MQQPAFSHTTHSLGPSPPRNSEKPPPVTEPAAQAPFFRYGMKMYNVGTLDASRCQAQWATAEPLLRQAASSSPICKRGRHEPTSTRLLARQSGSPVEAEVEKERGRGSVAMARDARARAGESSSYTQNPLPSGMGRIRSNSTT